MTSTVETDTTFNPIPLSTVNVDDVTNDTVPSTNEIDYQRIVNGTIASLIVVINGSTCVFIFKTSELKLRFKILIASLCGSDVLMGLMALLPRVLPWQPDSRDAACFVRFSGLFLSIYATAFTILLVALDRVLALTLPHVYRAKVTATRMSLSVAFIWGLSAVVMVVMLVGSFPPGILCDFPFDVITKRGFTILGAVLLLCVVANFFLYCILAWQMKKRSSQVAVRVHGGISLRPEKRTAVTGLSLAFVFCCGYLPLSLYLLWVTTSGIDIQEEGRSERLYIFVVCPLSCCVLDPIVYFWRIRSWRRAVSAKCRCPGSAGSDSQSSG